MTRTGAVEWRASIAYYDAMTRALQWCASVLFWAVYE